MIAVTGATGRLGGKAARILADAGVPLRMIVRDPTRAPALPGGQVAVATYTDAGALSSAFDGVDAVLMVSAHEGPRRVHDHQVFLDAVAAAGVPHLVYTSFLNAAPDATFTLARDHFHTEQHALALGLRPTFLRDNLYADALRAFVGPDDVIRGPAGDGAVSAVAREDVAAVAAAVLRDPAPHAGATYELTGPTAMTLAEIAALISGLTGRLVTYYPETMEEAYASRARYEAPPWQQDAWVSTYTAIANGEAARVSSAVPDLLGRPAVSISALLERRYRG